MSNITILKNFNVVSGINDDNIVTFRNTNPSTAVNNVKLYIDDTMQYDQAQVIYVSMSYKTTNGVYREFTKVGLGDLIKGPIQNVKTLVTNYLETILLGSNILYDVSKNYNSEITFKAKYDIRIAVVSDTELNTKLVHLGSGYTSTNTVKEGDLYKTTYDYEKVRIDYIINQLIVDYNYYSKGETQPVVIKKVNVNDGSEVSFNLRDIFSNTQTDSSLQLTSYITYQEREGETTDIAMLPKIHLIPNSKSEMYNTDYSNFYKKDNFSLFDMLTVSPENRRLVKGKKYVFSYIDITENPSDQDLFIELYDKNNVLIETKDIPYIVAGSQRGIIVDMLVDTSSFGNATKVKMYVADGGKQITNKLTLNLYSYCSNIVLPEIYFQNSLGGIDVVNMFNKVETKTSTSEQTTYMGELKGDRKVSNKNISKSLVLTTALLSKEEVKVYEDMCTSDRIWYYKGNEKRDILINRFESTISSETNQYILSIEIDDTNIL